MSEIKRNDIIEEAAIRAPLDMLANVQALQAGIKIFVESAKQMQQVISSTDSLAKVQKATQDLTREQAEYNKIQNQIATTQAKNNEINIAAAERLKKVRDELKLGQATADSWVRSANAQNSSLIQLERALNANRTAYASLRTEQERTSKSGQDLLKTLQAQDIGVKKLRESMGQHTESVGHYEKATESLKGSIETLIGRLGPAGAAIEEIGGKAVTAGTIFRQMGTGIGGVATALGALVAVSVTGFFTRTADGAKLLTIAVSRLEYEYNNFLNTFSQGADEVYKRLKEVGAIRDKKPTDPNEAKFIELSIEAKKLAKERIALEREESDLTFEINTKTAQTRDKENHSDQERLDVLKELNVIMEDLAKKAESLSQRTYDNELKRVLLLRGVSKYEQLLRPQQEELLAFYKNINESKNKFFDGLRLRQRTQISIEEEIHKRELEIAKETQAASTRFNQAEVNADIEKNNAILANIKSTNQERQDAISKNARNEVTIALNARLQAISEARAKTKERLRSAEGSQVFDFQLTTEEKNKAIDTDKAFKAELAAINKEYSTQTATIDDKKTKALIDNDNKYFIIAQDNQKALLEGFIETNIKIANSATANLEERVAASKAVTEDQIRILGITRDKAIRLAGTEKDELEKIDREYNNGKTKTLNESANYIAKIYQTDYENQIKIKKNYNEKLLNEDLKALDQSLLNNEIGITKYNRTKAKLIKDSQLKSDQDQLDGYLAEYAALKKQFEDIGNLTLDQEKTLAEINAKYNEIKAKQNELAVQKRIKLGEEEHAALVRLQQETLNAVVQIGNNQFNKQTAQLEAKIEKLKSSEQDEITIAGDNAAAKLAIESRYNSQIAVEQKKINKLKHDQAVFDRDVAIAQIIIQTAEGIAKAIGSYGYAGIPLAAIIGAVGTAQTAVAVSTPIPSYAKGTDNHPGGLAVVGEKGAEIAMDRKGNAVLYDVPGATLTHLDAGTQVFTADETKRILAGEKNAAFNSMVIASREPQRKSTSDILGAKLDKLTYVTENKKAAYFNITKQGMEALAREADIWKRLIDQNYRD